MTASFHSAESDGGTFTTAVILAGGRATRFGDLSALLPKSMFVVSPYDTALSRLLSQLVAAGISQIIVSTLPVYAPMFTEFVNAYCRTRLDDTLRRYHTISVFPNQRHEDGPIAGLIEVMQRHASERYLVCLADILFESNPMPELLEEGLLVQSLYWLANIVQKEEELSLKGPQDMSNAFPMNRHRVSNMPRYGTGLALHLLANLSHRHVSWLLRTCAISRH